MGTGVRYETHVGAPGLFLLNQSCLAIAAAFDSTPYLVGSAITTKDHRDVDVRLILDDEQFERLFPGFVYSNPRVCPLWSLMCSSISQHLAHATGLLVDFQIQSATAADAKFAGCKRVPLGIFPTVGGTH